MTTKIDKQTIPHFHLITGKDQLRPTMLYVRICKDYAVATNAHVMAWAKTSEIFNDEFISGLFETFKDYCADQSLEPSGDSYLYINANDWKIITGAEFLSIEDKNIVCKSKKGVSIIKPVNANDVGKYPNWKAVVPSGEFKAANIALNSELLYSLGKCIRTSRLSFLTEYTGKGILAIPAQDPDIICAGLIMPIMYEAKEINERYNTLKP